MKRIFALVYCLVLAVQMPHVATVYAQLERSGWYQHLGWPLAAAFEASILVFTYRIVVEKSTRSATRIGLGFFLLASSVANATYYSLWPALFSWLMPVFATLALPASLALFASEFGAEVSEEERQAQLAQRRIHRSELRILRESATLQQDPAAPELPPAPLELFTCDQCSRTFRNQHALSAHMRVHSAPVGAAPRGRPPQQEDR